MEIPSIARQSVSAEISVFAQVELEAFAEQSRRTSPLGWALVERLQRVCREESPATATGLEQAIHKLQPSQHEAASSSAYQAA